MRVPRFSVGFVAVAMMMVGTGLALLPACSLLLDDDFSRANNDAEAQQGANGDAGSDGSPPNGQDGVAPNNNNGAAAADGGVIVRGIDRAVLDSSSFIRLHPPAGTRAGDVLWAVTSTYYDSAVTAAPGFNTVTTNYNPACTQAGWRISVFVRIATDAEDATYNFDYKQATFDWAAGILIALSGQTNANASAIVPADNVIEHDSNPYASTPLSVGAAPAFGIITNVRQQGDNATFSVPSGLLRLGEHGGIAIFGKPVAAGTTFTAEPATVTPDGCGFTYTALLDLH